MATQTSERVMFIELTGANPADLNLNNISWSIRDLGSATSSLFEQALTIVTDRGKAKINRNLSLVASLFLLSDNLD
jgi:hypothetical protein